MTDRQEIRAKSMELALSFMGLAFELPITLDFAKTGGYGNKELDRAFESAVDWSKRFEAFILSGPSDS
jgi:hypothetical protein